MSDRGGYRKCRPGFAPAGLIVLLSLLPLGCSGGGRPQAGSDPLIGLGSPGLPKRGSVASRGLDKPLPLEPAAGATSQAALATGGRAGESDPRSWRDSSPTAVSLGPPGPVAAGASPPAMVPPVPGGLPDALLPVGASAETDRFVDQAIRGLELRGMKGFRLEQDRVTGQWRCTCSIPGRRNPGTLGIYDGIAADPRSAVQAVLDKVEQDSR